MSEAALSRATDLPAIWQDLRFEGAVKPAQMIAKSLWRHIVRHNNSLPDLHQGGAGNPFRSGARHVLLSENFFQLFTKIIGMKNMCQVMNLALMLQKALSGARLHIDHTKDFSIAGNLAIGADGELGLSGHIRNSLQLNGCLRLKGVDPDGSAASGQLAGFQFSHGFSGDLGGAGKLEVTSSQGAEEGNLLFSGGVHRLIPICAGPFPSPHVNMYSRLFCTLQRLFCKKATKMQNIMRT